MKPQKILAALVLLLMVIGIISSKSTIYMAQRDFKTWRRLSKAYGHEWVHRINDMKYKGIWINSKVSGVNIISMKFWHILGPLLIQV